MSQLVFALIISSVSLNALAQVSLRKGMLVLNANGGVEQPVLQLLVQLALNPFLILGLSLYAVSIFIWLYVLSKVEVSLAYPFQSLGYIIAATIGLFFLGENVTLVRAAGIGMICVGLVFIARSA